jgi:hypothetical protein
MICDEQLWRSRMHSSGHKGLITIMFVCLYAIYDVVRLQRCEKRLKTKQTP